MELKIKNNKHIKTKKKFIGIISKIIVIILGFVLLKNIFKYGNLVNFEGEFKAPDSARNYKGFDYSKYLKTKKIYGIIGIEKIDVINKAETTKILDKVLECEVPNNIYEELKNIL